MGLIHTFMPIESHSIKISNNFQFGCIQGDTGAVLEISLYAIFFVSL